MCYVCRRLFLFFCHASKWSEVQRHGSRLAGLASVRRTSFKCAKIHSHSRNSQIKAVRTDYIVIPLRVGIISLPTCWTTLKEQSPRVPSSGGSSDTCNVHAADDRLHPEVRDLASHSSEICGTVSPPGGCCK